MIKEILDSFVGLVDAVKEKPLATIAAGLLVTVAYGTYVNGEKLHQINSNTPTPAIEKGRFERSLKMDDEINSSLKNIREATGADRVVVKQFHNGRHDLSGLPFTSISMTYVSMRPGIGIDPSAYNPMPMAGMNHTLKNMWVEIDNPKCVAINVSSIDDQTYKAFLMTNSVVKVINCPMTNLLKYPIGYISLGYIEPPKKTDEELIAELKNSSDKIVGYLDHIKNGKDEKEKKLTNLFGLL